MDSGTKTAAFDSVQIISRGAANTINTLFIVLSVFSSLVALSTPVQTLVVHIGTVASHYLFKQRFFSLIDSLALDVVQFVAVSAHPHRNPKKKARIRHRGANLWSDPGFLVLHRGWSQQSTL
jgi:hypothetical protein